MSNLNLYRLEKDRIRKNLNKYTRKAFTFIPKLENPHILDVGCGTGVPTIELAKLSEGYVIGLDNDVKSLNLFQRKIKESKLNKRIIALKDSILTMDFPEESCDIIWAEGSIFIIGFENSVKNWHRYLKPNGFLVIHDETKDKTKKLGLITKYGYTIIAQFELSATLWRREYYAPLEQLIQQFHFKYPNDVALSNELDKDQIEIDKCKSNSLAISSFFVILQKI